MDKFQERYLGHQDRKKKILLSKIDPVTFNYTKEDIKTFKTILKQRRSRRIYDEGLTDEEIVDLIKHVYFSPSSCNRKGVYMKPCDKDLIDLLVGARDWHKNGSVVAFFANKEAYKSEWEKDYMPYLDAGVMIQTTYLYCEVKGYKCCFINPNTHGKYKSEDIFCGAMAIGK